MTSAGELGKTVADLSHPLADFRHDFGGPKHLERFLASAAKRRSLRLRRLESAWGLWAGQGALLAARRWGGVWTKTCVM